MDTSLLQQLKDAGFPFVDKTERFSNHEEDTLSIDNTEYVKIGGTWFMVPNLSELIEECGDRFLELKKTAPERGKLEKRWLVVGGVGEFTPDGLKAHNEFGKTPSEAVSKLWLALNKKDG